MPISSTAKSAVGRRKKKKNWKRRVTLKEIVARTYTKEEVDNLIIQALRSQNTTPIHIHNCPEGHQWPCMSTYCEDVSSVPRLCVAHNGPLPIVKGQEPWRGTR